MAFAQLTLLEYLTPLYPPTLSVRQVSEITSETEQTIRNAISQHRYPIPSFKIGSKRVFTLIEVAAYLDGLRAADPSHPANLRPQRGRPTKVQQQAKLLAGTSVGRRKDTTPTLGRPA
ncbi:helix-turn-helix domain-containing protein [Cupriavidus basilensis]|uniref:helix-turn-helix domain-containing protein n=1 Tax=Cupriavidus basilensis TaxID=68895 RepID=UPI00284358B6|nr:helix-turn-helix domain-containing protein [Cupriavidus basilensis]MDR3383928.1 helix-turn-helix domain-containing protein [Cupriavidus basilensis]